MSLFTDTYVQSVLPDPGSSLQFAGSLFTIFERFFSRIILSYSTNIPENVVEFCYVLSKLNNLACS